MAKKLGIVAIVVLAIVAILSVWFIPQVVLYNKYEDARMQLNADFGESYKYQPMDNATKVELQTIKNTWQLNKNDTPYDITETLVAVDYPASIKGFIDLCNFKLPDFSWLDAEKNSKNLNITSAQIRARSISIDYIIYVDEEERLAFIRPAKEMIILYRETNKGLAEEIWINTQHSDDDEDENEKEEG